jgi:signal transduction histidine kinase
MRWADALITVGCMTTDCPAEGAGVPARRWFPAGLAEGQWLASVVLAVVAVAVAVMLAVFAGPGVRQTGGGLLLPALVCVPVVVLRRWPLPVLAVVTAADGLVMARGFASFPFGLLVGVALYFSALRLPRPKSIVLAVAVATVLGATVVYAAFVTGITQVPAEVVMSLVPPAAAWFIADSVASRRRYQVALAGQRERERAAEVRAERLRIAREMHDVVAHSLAVMTVQAGVGRRLAAKRPEEASSALESIETIGRTAQDELRVVLGLLRDGDGDGDAGVGAAPLAPAPRLVDVKVLAETVRASGVPVDLRMSGTDRRLSPSLELSVYRVMQEALTNVVKHAPGARAVAELTVSAATIRVDVRDDGGPGGSEAPRARPGGSEAPGAGPGHGIVGMRERIGAFGGWLAAGPAAGGGFEVTAEVPIERAAS